MWLNDEVKLAKNPKADQSWADTLPPAAVNLLLP